VQTEAGYQIQDMGSTNGTFVDDKRLGSDALSLRPGMAIRFGSGVILDYLASTGQEAVMSTVVDASSEKPSPAPLGGALPTEAYHSDDLPPMPEFDEDYVAPVSVPRYTREAPPPMSPPPPPPSPPLVASSTGKGGRRRRTIIIVAALLLLCCCCAALVSGYYYWGDPLLEFLRDAGWISF
jgi:pSer/pThr/pTyr-binding forkhead associated (FHA) protein